MKYETSLQQEIQLPTVSYLQEMEKRILNKIEDLETEKKSKLPLWVKSARMCTLMDNISPNKLKEMRLKGEIPYTKIGGICFYNLEEVKQAFRSRNSEMLSKIKF